MIAYLRKAWSLISARNAGSLMAPASRHLGYLPLRMARGTGREAGQEQRRGSCRQLHRRVQPNRRVLNHELFESAPTVV